MAESRNFQLVAGLGINVLAINLFEGERFIVRYALDLGCAPADAEYADYYENGKLVMLDTEHNPLTLWRPGWYKLVADGALNDDVQVHTQVFGPMAISAPLDNVAEADNGH